MLYMGRCWQWFFAMSLVGLFGGYVVIQMTFLPVIPKLKNLPNQLDLGLCAMSRPLSEDMASFVDTNVSVFWINLATATDRARSMRQLLNCIHNSKVANFGLW